MGKGQRKGGCVKRCAHGLVKREVQRAGHAWPRRTFPAAFGVVVKEPQQQRVILGRDHVQRFGRIKRQRGCGPIAPPVPDRKCVQDRWA